MSVKPRDISPFLQAIRQFLLGRPHTTALRFEQFVSSRSPPPPCIPDGATHKLAANYYCNRDVRREVAPPALIASPAAQIVSGDGKASPEGEAPQEKRLPTPGKVFHWD